MHNGAGASLTRPRLCENTTRGVESEKLYE